jgi:hypothetical protein
LTVISVFNKRQFKLDYYAPDHVSIESILTAPILTNITECNYALHTSTHNFYRDCVAMSTTDINKQNKRLWAKHGKQQSWYSNGQLRYLGTYESGRMYGSQIYWYSDAKIKCIRTSVCGMTDRDDQYEEDDDDDTYDIDYDYSEYKPWKHDPSFFDNYHRDDNDNEDEIENNHDI